MCSMMPGKKKMKRMALTELYVNGNFTGGRNEGGVFFGSRREKGGGRRKN